MPAAEYDFIDDQAIEQGATWARQFLWKDSTGALIDLTGYTARMQLRAARGATGDPLLSLTTENGGITLGGTAGSIDTVATAAQTAALTASGGAYDLELIAPSGTVTRFLRGKFRLSREVTR